MLAIKKLQDVVGHVGIKIDIHSRLIGKVVRIDNDCFSSTLIFQHDSNQIYRPGEIFLSMEF